MATDKRSRADLIAELEELRIRLTEAEETLHAIGSGAVDAFVVSTPEGEQVFTLRGAEHPYRVLMESMNEGAATLSTDGIVVYCNGGLAALLKFPLEKLIGSRFSTYIAPPDHTGFESLCTRGHSRAETVLLTGTGERLPVLLSCSNIDHGEVQGSCVVVTDLSEQKRAEKIIAAEELARSILEQAGEAIVVCDDRGRIIRASRQAQQFGRGILPLLQFDELLPLQIAGTEHFFSVSAPLEGEIFKNVEVVLTQQKGETYHLLLNATPLKSGSNIFGCVVTLTDITERKHAEEELRRAHDQLESTNRELEAFTSSVSHDLKKPLTIIGGYAQALMDLCSELNDECRGFVREIYQGTMAMGQLIDTLLNFSSLARREVRKKAVDLSEVARTIATELQAQEPERRVTFAISDEVVVHGDAGLLRVVLENILGNAWKYTSNLEEAVIEFGITEAEPKACFVRDNGAGFSMEDADKVFVPFQRLPGTGGYQGHGIGLATVERIITRHGGKVWAEGKPGKGATFYFTLPPESAEHY